ncbi:Sodium potassium calcium exchanger [Nesidiocoris tenuis]|uniref:Sodium potassium calcium exchanger n=1 Tax=Nesidiocoris tenuis TaxID=355587 RepID=A0ABN7B245_9HEMI|nr:Sodium potassium calcium exchanger [Nesidiocoris tenuis]
MPFFCAGLGGETPTGGEEGGGGGGGKEVVSAEELERERNCTPPAIEQFPRPLIGPSARKHGALLFHVIVCIYSFIGLAIVCDYYFVTSLDRICEVLKLTPDVAGATFMAAGSSAPELATVIIAVFFAKDDIGVSGVIGSAVFNIMFVIGICAVFGGTVSYLNWWPLCRDSFFYLLSILIMLIVMYDKKITWGESTVMLIMYVIYCLVLWKNTVFEAWAHTLPIPCQVIHTEPPPQVMSQATPQANEGQSLVSYKNVEDGGYGAAQGMANGGEPGVVEMQEPVLPRPDYYKAKEPSTVQVSPLLKPETDEFMTLLQWRLCYPIHYTAQATMPDCRLEKYSNWYPFTFFISMVWISFYSYIMVWMITIIGSTLGIPDTVMGLTFVAAGVSVPDALSSLAVVKEGYGDMAVSNAVGSNVFDILVCLGLPWFLKTAIIKPGSYVKVFSKGLTYSTLTLLSTVVFLIVITHMNGWKMDRKYGITLMLWYVFFICFASLYELNVFGNLNPPECSTEY